MHKVVVGRNDFVHASFLRENSMETNNQINEPKPKDNSVSIVLIIFGVLGLFALVGTILFCGAAFLFMRGNKSLPAILATPVPTVDIVKATNDDPMWRLIMDDGFDKNDNGWPVNTYKNDNVSLDRKIENSKYTWEFQAKNGWSFYGYPDLNKFTDFVVSAEFKHTQGALFDSYGFVLRSTNDRHYYFQISEMGRYSFGYRSDEKNTLLLEGETQFILPNESNQITVKAEGSRFTIFVNNIQIADVEDNTFPSGWVGLLLSPSGYPANAPDSDAQDTSFSTQDGYPSRFEVDNFKFWISATDNTVDKKTPLPPLLPDSGRLVFVSSRDGNREIYTLDTNGNDLDRLTNNPADDFSPKWSPNGNQIVFVSTREGNPNIFIMNADGSDITRLTDNSGNNIEPSWSPDGKKIVFASNRDGNYNLYILDVKAKTIERITEAEANDHYPDWSPNGEMIFFQSNRNSGINFYALTLQTQQVSQITLDTTSSSNHPSWSPNGLFIVYEKTFSAGGVGIVIKEFPNKSLFTLVSAYRQMNSWPAWSPDGSQIVFVSNRDGQTDIYIISKDGTAIYRLTNDPAIESEVHWTAE
jgi:WD40 repeat protein